MSLSLHCLNLPILEDDTLLLFAYLTMHLAPTSSNSTTHTLVKRRPITLLTTQLHILLNLFGGEETRFDTLHPQSSLSRHRLRYSLTRGVETRLVRDNKMDKSLSEIVPICMARRMVSPLRECNCNVHSLHLRFAGILSP